MVLDRDESAAAARMLQSLVLIMFLQDARAGTARAWPLQAASTESTLDRGTAQIGSCPYRVQLCRSPGWPPGSLSYRTTLCTYVQYKTKAQTKKTTIPA